MTALDYIGKVPTTAKGIANKKQVQAVLALGTNRTFVDDRVLELAALKAYKTYVDSQDGLYSEAAYFGTQDALNVPNSQKGVANGIAALDSNGKIPSAQMAILGVGTLKGPYGVASVSTGTTGQTPIKIATWNLGITAVAFKPMIFFMANVTVSGIGRPVIEVRIGDPSQTTYAAETLVASGHGRTNYDDLQNVRVLSGADAPGRMQDGIQSSYSPSTNWHLDAWLFDATTTGQVSMNTGQIAVASCYLMRIT